MFLLLPLKNEILFVSNEYFPFLPKIDTFLLSFAIYCRPGISILFID